MLDDVFSGLDAETEDQVFHRLFGASGLLREHHKTVVIVSSSGMFLDGRTFLWNLIIPQVSELPMLIV